MEVIKVRSDNKTNIILKILYIIIALTSFMLIRNYSYMNPDGINNTNNTNTSTNSSYTENYNNQSNSSFYELEGEDFYD